MRRLAFLFLRHTLVKSKFLLETSKSIKLIVKKPIRKTSRFNYLECLGAFLKQKMLSQISFLFLKTITGFVFLFYLLSCSAGGDLINPTPEKAASIVVPVPLVTFPADSVYYSNQNNLTITGMCQTSSTIRLSGLYDNQSLICQNSVFSFSVSQASDAVNYYTIQQIQTDGNVSYPVNVIWIRKSTVAKPVITTPSTNPYSSSDSELTLSGTCESESTVTLSGDGAGSVKCANSAFSLKLPKAVDGDFNIVVSQTDKAGNSAQVNFLWKRYSLTVSPQSATIPVDTDQPITITGGSGVYTLTLLENNSGGSLDTANKVYHTGTLAGVVDKIKIVDSLGIEFILSIATTAGAVDHISYGATSGHNQTITANTTLPVSLTAKVVDQFENPIVLYPVYFRQVIGDGLILSSPVQISDLNGQVQVQVKSGIKSLKNTIEVGPINAVLPDVAGTGQSHLKFNYSVTFANKAQFGATFGLSTSPLQVVSADVDGDSILDAVVVNNGEPSVGVLVGLGNGLFKDMVKIKPVCVNPTQVTLADVNNDTKLDIIILCGSAAYGQGASLANVMQIFIGDGSGHFAAAQNIPVDVNESVPIQFVIGDFNGDSKVDIALAISSYLAASTPDDGAVTFRFGDGHGQFSATPQYIETGKGTNGLIAGHFNSTSKLDLAVINSTTNQLQFLFNNTATTGSTVAFDTTNTQPLDPSPLQIKSLTVNGRMALAVLTGSGKINLFNDDGTSSGSFYALDSLNVGLSVTSIATGDVSRDSIDDILVTNSDENNMTYFKGQSDGSFIQQTSITTTGVPVAIDLGFVNQDLYKDILIVGAENSVLEFIPGRSDGMFGFTYDLTDLTGSITKVASADFDGDSKADLALLSPADRNIHIMRGAANGLFTLVNTILDTQDNSNYLTTADLRGSGLQDIIVSNPNRNTVKVFLGLGNGGFATGVEYAVGNSPNFILVKDINRDGNPDLIVSNGNSNSVTILYGNGSGGFPTKITKTLGTNPVGLVVTDLNNDGVIDIVALSRGDSKINVLMGSGQNATYILSNYVGYDIGDGSADPSYIIEHDTNNDSYVDIITANAGDGSMSVLKGKGDGSFQTSVQYAGVDSPSAMTTGDFTGDGRLDVAIWSNTSSTYTLLPSNASGLFTLSPITLDLGQQIGGLFHVDLNADSKVDFVSTNGTGHSFKVWLGH